MSQLELEDRAAMVELLREHRGTEATVRSKPSPTGPI